MVTLTALLLLISTKAVVVMPKGKKDEKPVIEEKFQQLEVNVKDPKTVILMLDSPEVSVVCKACQSLQQYMEKSEQNCLELHSLGVVPLLVKLLNSTEKVVCSCTLIALGVMIPHLPVRRSMLSLECVPSLLKMLKPEEDLYILERAVYVVANLAEEYTFKQRLVEGNACQILLPLLSHTDCDVIRHTVKGLSLLTAHHTARKSIAEENGFPLLLAQLDSEYAEIQETVLIVLEHCLQDNQCRTSFNGSDGLAKITEFLNKQEWNDLHVLAIDVLTLCLLSDNGMEALHGSNCLQRLLESIQTSQLPQMKTKATRALANASRDAVSKKILHEQEAEKTFIELLFSQSEDVCIAACDALRGLSSLTSSCQYIGREGGVKQLVALLLHANDSVRSAAVSALSSVIKATIANCNIISEIPGGMESLVNLLADDNTLSRISTALCIVSMCPSGALRLSLVQNGAMEALAKCLSHTDSKVLCAATQAIALLAIDSHSREKFPSDSTGNLLELLHSSDTAVCRNSIWALAILVQNKTVAEAVFIAKGTQTLTKLIDESQNRDVREYGKLALDRLLAGDLAAKYNITKKLSPKDILKECEFWDMGMAEAKGFIPLQMLMNQTASMNKPVIAVSLLNKPASSQANSAENEEEMKPKDEPDTLSNRSKSRQAQHGGSRESNKSTGKKGGSKEKHTERQNSPEEENQNSTTEFSQPAGLLQPDLKLWEHIENVQKNIQNVENVRNQVEKLAIYVSQSMGGQLTLETALQHELPLAEIQGNTNSPIVLLGSVKKGTFQHRALLFKVLADQLGIPCSLQKGQYNRYWNTVLLDQSEVLVDVMFTPSKMWPPNSQEALHYQTV